MINDLVEFFYEIKTINLWEKSWKKKIIGDANSSIFRICERKFRDNEVKEIFKDSKNNVIYIKEYRYDEVGYLFKIVMKDSNASIEYINEIVYDEDYNIKCICGINQYEDYTLYSIFEYKDEKIIKEQLVKKYSRNKDEILLSYEYVYNDYDNIEIISTDSGVYKDYHYNLSKNIVEVTYKGEKGLIIGIMGYAFREFIIKDLSKQEKYESFIVPKGLALPRDFVRDDNSLFTKIEKLKDQCYYNENGDISKIIYTQDGKVNYVSEYIYD